MTYLKLFKEKINVREFIEIFIRIIILKYEVSEEIISDRDKLFIFQF